MLTSVSIHYGPIRHFLHWLCCNAVCVGLNPSLNGPGPEKVSKDGRGEPASEHPGATFGEHGEDVEQIRLRLKGRRWWYGT
jgi:hypothetical protein